MSDIYADARGDVNTLEHLGPLAALAGVWEGTGTDRHPGDPQESPVELDAYDERYELQPIDFQTNGPQLVYGLRYHTRIVRTGETAMFHEQVGFWLWEPATWTVVLTLAIPRGQVALASGRCEPDARTFEVRATRGSTEFGICSVPFLDASFRTLDFAMTVYVRGTDSWSYEQNTRLKLPDRAEPFDHKDSNGLRRIAAPTPNPLSVAGTEPTAGRGLNIGSLRK